MNILACFFFSSSHRGWMFIWQSEFSTIQREQRNWKFVTPFQNCSAFDSLPRYDLWLHNPSGVLVCSKCRFHSSLFFALALQFLILLRWVCSLHSFYVFSPTESFIFNALYNMRTSTELIKLSVTEPAQHITFNHTLIDVS